MKTNALPKLWEEQWLVNNQASEGYAPEKSLISDNENAVKLLQTTLLFSPSYCKH